MPDNGKPSILFQTDDPCQSSMRNSAKKTRLVGAALNPHQRRRVEETSFRILVTALHRSIQVDRTITFAEEKIKNFLCIASIYFNSAALFLNIAQITLLPTNYQHFEQLISLYVIARPQNRRLLHDRFCCNAATNFTNTAWLCN